MRTILVEWLIEVAEEYYLTSQTLHLTVNYVDRFLARNKIPRASLQLLGVTCMLIASYVPSPPSIPVLLASADYPTASLIPDLSVPFRSRPSLFSPIQPCPVCDLLLSPNFPCPWPSGLPLLCRHLIAFSFRKFEEIYAPLVDDFAFITDNTYSRSDVRPSSRPPLTHSSCFARLALVHNWPTSSLLINCPI